MNRFLVAMGAYGVIAIVAWTKLTAPIPHSGFELRHIVLAVLGALAVSTWVHRRDRGSSDPESSKKDVEGGSGQ